jgi:RNA polymerase sigma factor (sigma-70 family)
MANPANGSESRHRPYVAAMLLGTALTALGPMPADAAPNPEVTSRVIADINRYCTSCWRNARLPTTSWSDCTQEVFARLLQRLPDQAWTRVLEGEGEERREFVRAIDAVKKRTQRARKWIGSYDGIADAKETNSRDIREQRDLVLQTAQEVLTTRQERILRMSFEGWSVNEIAKQLETSAERVSDEKYKAIRKLRAHLAETHNDQQADLDVPSTLPA